MNRPFAIYPDSFDGDTLGYWRFGECGGRLTPVGAGPAFVNHGAEAVEDGYRFVRADSDYMDAAYPDQPERSQLTMEGWVRGVGEIRGGDTGDRQRIITLFLDGDPGNNYISLLARTMTDPTTSYLLGYEKVGGAYAGDIQWTGQEVDDLLMSPDPWHFAVVLDAVANRFRLFINGVQRAQDASGIVAFPSGDQTLRLGKYEGGSVYNHLDGVLDEARFSGAVRYAGGVNETRYFRPVRFGEGRRVLARGPGDGVSLGGMAA